MAQEGRRPTGVAAWVGHLLLGELQGRDVAQRPMWTDVVVFPTPVLKHHTSFGDSRVITGFSTSEPGHNGAGGVGHVEKPVADPA